MRVICHNFIGFIEQVACGLKQKPSLCAAHPSSTTVVDNNRKAVLTEIDGTKKNGITIIGIAFFASIPNSHKNFTFRWTIPNHKPGRDAMHRRVLERRYLSRPFSILYFNDVTSLGDRWTRSYAKKTANLNWARPLCLKHLLPSFALVMLRSFWIPLEDIRPRNTHKAVQIYRSSRQVHHYLSINRISETNQWSDLLAACRAPFLMLSHASELRRSQCFSLISYSVIHPDSVRIYISNQQNLFFELTFQRLQLPSRNMFTKEPVFSVFQCYELTSGQSLWWNIWKVNG